MAARAKAKSVALTPSQPNGQEGGTVTTGIVIPRLDARHIRVPITGVTSLICEAWSHKAKQMMLDKQMKKAAGPRAAKNPEEDFKNSLYVSDEGWFGFPAGGFKSALVGACRMAEGISMTLSKRLCFVLHDGFSTSQNIELVRLYGEPRIRQDMMRNETGVADIRYHAEFLEWRAVLTIEYNAGMISREQLVHLVSLAGYGEGIGGHRPSAPKNCTGDHGRWKIDESGSGK